ncbi:TetR/AcrR family transcriptional regulator [Nonomuraea sp. NPDC048826]|uniref:TetR/AcrR family transcriptional regulator n=1 Tax=Nonomuraea sp. NPDC048826 TaxID=3364347 RepID=UPI0037172FB9
MSTDGVRAAGRRRGAELESAILRAAVAELSESGYAGLTMDRVARRAGTNKNAIYRRWPNRAALGVAAYRRLATDKLSPPDTGGLREDVLMLLRRINCGMASPQAEILRGLLAGVGDEPELLAELHAALADGGAGVWLTVVGRAVARGEAPPEALHPRVVTVALTLLRNEYVTRGLTTVPDADLVEIVDEVYLPLLRGRGLTPGP